LSPSRAPRAQGKWEEALVELNKVLQKDAKNVEALKERAKVHIKLKQVVEAEFDIKEGHRLKPDSPEFDILQAHVCRLEVSRNSLPPPKRCVEITLARIGSTPTVRSSLRVLIMRHEQHHPALRGAMHTVLWVVRPCRGTSSGASSSWIR